MGDKVVALDKEDLNLVYQRIDQIFTVITDMKEELKQVLRIEERVDHHHDTLTRFGGDIEKLKERVNGIRLDMAERKGQIEVKRDYEKIFWRIVTPVITSALILYVTVGS